MRKFFTSLKSVVAATVVVAMTLATSCSYDDSAINERVDKVEKDLAALTERVKALEDSLKSEVPTLEELLDGKSVIVNVTTDENGNTILELSNGKTVTVLGPCGYEPCDHECQPCDCDTLQYRVVDGILEVSADGENWIAINGVTADQVVADVIISEDGNSATIVLANGDEFTVVKAELIECSATRSQLYVAPDSTRELIFTVNDAVTDINIMNQPLGWKAAIDVAPAAEDDVDPEMGVLAAGGTDFLLKITGPTADFVKAGYAEKEGYVSVHFNSANGGCKVARVLVNLAELTLDVDAAGNITLTNSVAESAGVDEMGNAMYDFANFYIGVMDAADYATYGDSIFVDTYDDLANDYSTNVAFTQRTTGFQNYMELQYYEAGVLEQEVYNFTVDKLATFFYPHYTFEMGKEYIIFVTTESEMAGYVEQPVLASAVKASYKRVFVQAELDEESITWNDASVNFTLAGFNYYSVGWIATSELQQLIDYGMAADFDSAIAAYINAYGPTQAGAVINDVTGTYKLSELATLSMTDWAPALSADTEYHFFVYAFNAETEMDLYMHQFVEENLHYYGAFSTKALVQGDFNADAQFELVQHDLKNIKANVTFSEDVVTVMYNWFDASFLDPEEALVALTDDYSTEVITLDETATFEASGYDYYNLSNPIYFVGLAINAAGEYVYVEKAFELELPETVAIESFQFLGRSYDLDEDESTSGGDYVYNVVCADGNEFKIGVYYTYANEDGTLKDGTLEYRTNKLDSMYSYWAGFVIVSDTMYSGSKLVVEGGKITLTLVANDMYVGVYEYTDGGEEPVVPGGDVVAVSANAYFDVSESYVTFVNFVLPNSDIATVAFRTGDGGWDSNLFFNKGLDYINAGQWTTWADRGDNTVWYTNAYLNSEQATIDGNITVSYLDDTYGFKFKINDYNVVYNGAVEGLVAPQVTGLPTEVVDPEPGELTELTIHSHITIYSMEGSEHEIGFYYDYDNSLFVDLDFFACPITAGTYTFENEGLYDFYCKSHGSSMKECTAIVTDNGDGTLTFDVTYTLDNATLDRYHFNYTAQIYS